MNALNSRQLSPLLAIACRSTGAIMIASYLLTALVTALPPNFQSRDWLSFSFITPTVDTGVIALMGIVLLLGSSWVDAITRDNQANPDKKSILPMISFSLAGAFSLFFVILLILHLWNLFQWRGDQIKLVAEQAIETETELTQRLNQQLDQQKDQLTVLFENTGLRTNAIERGQLSPEVVAILEQLDTNPEGLNEIETQRQEKLNEGEQQIQKEIGLLRQERQEAIARRALKSGLGTGIDSLLLAVGFGLIAGTGFLLAK